MVNPKKEFSRTYDQNIDRIYRFIFLKVSSVEVAEDLASEAFTRYWDYRKNQDQDVENPRAFLYQVARNLVTDHYRREGRTQIVSTDNVPIIDPSEDVEEKIKTVSDLENVQFALADLKDDYQNVIIWHYLDDLPIKEVAQLLDKTEKNTRVLLHRALKALKKKV